MGGVFIGYSVVVLVLASILLVAVSIDIHRARKAAESALVPAWIAAGLSVLWLAGAGFLAFGVIELM